MLKLALLTDEQAQMLAGGPRHAVNAEERLRAAQPVRLSGSPSNRLVSMPTLDNNP
ncbi:MAG: hypothetical protein IPK42_25155 [Betaproteobacteria bacterium]|nr:hypothetical protein [Betaproteobacteria bacterium]